MKTIYKRYERDNFPNRFYFVTFDSGLFHTKIFKVANKFFFFINYLRI